MQIQVCVITGATGGIGHALSIIAAYNGYDLILHGRSEDKLKTLMQQIEVNFPETKLIPITGDLSSAAETRKLASKISEHAPRIDLLFNNAGVLLDGIKMSNDGLEMHTQVNLIAPYILMQTLKPNIAAAKGTIINVSSGSALKVKNLSIEALIKPKKSKKIFGAYAASKLALSIVTKELGDNYAINGIVLACADPGPSKTEMTSGDGMPGLLLLIRPFIYSSPEKGAQKVFKVTQLAKSQPQTGVFFSGHQIITLPKFAQSKDMARQLVEFCNQHAGLFGDGRLAG